MNKENITYIRGLYKQGLTLQEILQKLMQDGLQYKLEDVKIICWLSSYGYNATIPPYIDDKRMREKKIAELTNTRGKEYKELLYLGYLKGDVTEEQLEFAYINAAIEKREAAAERKIQQEREWWL